MKLPSTFQFSQSSLQDYVDCPRRFQLRFLLMQPWPAIVAEPAWQLERHLWLGAEFHRLAHQYRVGVDPERLRASIHDEKLSRWWTAFLENPPTGLPEARWSEAVVSAPAGSHRLMAKFDLLAVDPGKRLVVVDWKTSPKRPPRVDLALRMQTRVYRLLAVEAGSSFNQGQRPRPEQVEMLYWYADIGGHTERIPYDVAQYQEDAEYVRRLIAEVAELEQPIWQLTDDPRHCRFCKYRSLCDRGVIPGFASELDDDLEVDEPVIDLELVPEIEY